ncbi:MAG: hypothetical protein P8Y69_12830, partial [Gammaproteobacteria bacterium]
HGNYGEFVGAFAVVVSMIYLARQVRQNTLSQNRQEQNISYEQWTTFRHFLLEHPDLEQLIQQAGGAPDTLSEQEVRIVNVLRSEYMWLCFNVWDRVNRGVNDPVHWNSLKPSLREVFGAPGNRDWWAINSELFGDGFAQEIEDIAG